MVDSGTSMHMVSKRDLNSAGLESIEESDDGDDGQRRGAKKRRSSGFRQRIGLFVTVMLLEETPAVLSLGSSARIMGFPTTGPAVKNHISPERARELIAIYQTMDHSLSLVFLRVPLQRPRLLHHHLHHGIPNLTSADTPKNPVTERSGITSEEQRGTALHKPTETENKNKNEGLEEVQSDPLRDLPDWLQDFTLRLRIKTLPVLLLNYQWSREQKWCRVRVNIVSTRTFRRTQIAISASRQK